MDQQFIFGYYMEYVLLSNIFIFLNNSDTFPETDLVHLTYTRNFIANSIDIYDSFTSQYGYEYLFNIEFASQITIQNTTVKPSLTRESESDDTYINVGTISCTNDFITNNITIDNLHVEDHYVRRLFYFGNCQMTNITVRNIILDNVNGDYFFIFYLTHDGNALLESIHFDGKGKKIENDFLYVTVNEDQQFTITNCVFKNIILSQSATLFKFERVYPNTNIIFISDIEFTDINMMQGIDGYGMIYFDYNVPAQVIISNCTFNNNSNISALIQCAINSYCRINITNTVFNTNIGGNYDEIQMINGIILDEGANGVVYINASTFVGIGNTTHTFWYKNDSTIKFVGDENTFVIDATSPTHLPTYNLTTVGMTTNTPTPEESVQTQNPTISPSINEYSDKKKKNNESESLLLILIVTAILFVTICGIAVVFLFVKSKNRRNFVGDNNKLKDKVLMPQRINIDVNGNHNLNIVEIASTSPTNEPQIGHDTNCGIDIGAFNADEQPPVFTNGNINHKDGEIDHEVCDDQLMQEGNNGTSTGVLIDDNRNQNVRKEVTEYEKEMNQRFNAEIKNALETNKIENFGENIKAKDELENVVMNDIIGHMHTSQ